MVKNNTLSEKCKGVLKEVSCDKTLRRAFVGCRAKELRIDKGMKFGESMKEAWKEIKSKCK